jgi:hypothetical protein
MRAVLVPTLWLCACWLSACQSDDFGGNFPRACAQDSDCSGGEVCARAGSCFPTDQIRQIAVVWTVDGQPASEAACGDHQNFTLQFDSNVGYSYGYEPVPCRAGKFSVDKMPTVIDFVEMFDDSQAGADGSIDESTAQATLDLKLGDLPTPAIAP